MTICNWEADRTSPQLRLVPMITEFLDYDPYDRRPGTLGQGILAHRRALGLTQEGLGHRLGIDPSTLGRWERGEGQPSPKLHRLLLELFPDLVKGGEIAHRDRPHPPSNVQRKPVQTSTALANSSDWTFERERCARGPAVTQ